MHAGLKGKERLDALVRQALRKETIPRARLVREKPSALIGKRQIRCGRKSEIPR